MYFNVFLCVRYLHIRVFRVLFTRSTTAALMSGFCVVTYLIRYCLNNFPTVLPVNSVPLSDCKHFGTLVPPFFFFLKMCLKALATSTPVFLFSGCTHNILLNTSITVSR